MRALKMLAAAALVMVEVGCGLPNPYYLSAPGTGTFVQGTDYKVTFNSPGYLLGSNFTGFEVYYKFITGPTPSSSDINLGGGGVTGPFVLQANGFYPVARSTDSPGAPSLPVIVPASTDATSPLTVTVDFLNSVYYYQVSGSSTTTTPVPIARNLANNQGSQTGCRSFDPRPQAPYNYLQSDFDVSSIWSACASTASGSGVSYILVYALAFGLQNGSVQEWSVPVYLGFVQITPFP